MGEARLGKAGENMKYIIMCGRGNLRQLCWVNNETVVEHTIRLLRAKGIQDIAISSNNPAFEGFGVPVLHHENVVWLDAFYPTDEPTCYLFGDVVFSPEAINTIVDTETADIEFFASAPPFSPEYLKSWAEPFAFKVQNVQRFRECIEKTKKYYKEAKLRRAISWELWQVIKDTPLGKIDYTNYTVINDYTCDIDTEGDAKCFAQLARCKGGL